MQLVIIGWHICASRPVSIIFNHLSSQKQNARQINDPIDLFQGTWSINNNNNNNNSAYFTRMCETFSTAKICFKKQNNVAGKN